MMTAIASNVKMVMAVLLLCLNVEVQGYKHPEVIDITIKDWNGPFSEGPMYALKDFTLFSTGSPLIGFTGEATLSSADANYMANLSIIYSSNDTFATRYDVAYINPCSTKKNETHLSDAILHHFGELNEVRSFLLQGGQVVPINFDAPIAKTGYQLATFVLCSNMDTKARVSGVLKFRNPFGYLPATIFGYLPFSGTLAILYFILALVYGFLAFRHRDSVLRIQIFVFLVIIMGFIETTTWFLTFEMLNQTGERPCCPPRNDILFAVGTSNLKRTVSALLILSVSIGWGVAKPILDFSTSLKITILGLLHFAFSVYNEMKRIEVQSKVEHESPSILWSIPVAVCNVIFVFWIYFALENVQEELQQLRQHAKLEMYQRLSRTLAIWVTVWIFFTLFLILVSTGKITLSWQFDFVLFAFWDLLYFGILLSIARIWIPSRSSSDYAYSQQIPSTDVLDEFDSSALEMNAPVQAVTNNEYPVKASRVDENDDDDVDIDIGLDDGNGGGKGKKSSKVANA